MSDQPPDDAPKHKMVDGELVELTQDEIDAIMAERAAAEPSPDPEPEPEPTHARSRSKRR